MLGKLWVPPAGFLPFTVINHGRTSIMSPKTEPIRMVIERVGNGWLLTTPEDSFFIAEADEESKVHEAYMDLLWTVAEYFGLTGGRYDARRIRITTEAGDKYEWRN